MNFASTAANAIDGRSEVEPSLRFRSDAGVHMASTREGDAKEAANGLALTGVVKVSTSEGCAMVGASCFVGEVPRSSSAFEFSRTFEKAGSKVFLKPLFEGVRIGDWGTTLLLLMSSKVGGWKALNRE